MTIETSAVAPSTTPTSTPAPSSSPASPPKRMTSADFQRKAQNFNAPDPAFSNDADDSVDADTSVDTSADSNDIGDLPSEVADANATPWYEQYKEGLHGVQLQELLAALQEGVLPESLYDKLRIELRDGDNVWEDTISGARNGAMMRQSFQKKTQQVANMRKQLDAAYAEFNGLVDSWKKDPKSFIHYARQLEMPLEDIAFQVAEELATREAYNKQHPGSGDRWYEAIKKEGELSFLKQQQERQRTQSNQRQEAARERATIQDIRSNAEKAAKELGFTWDNARWRIFKGAVANHYEETGKPPKFADVRRYAEEAHATIEEAIGARDRATPKKQAAPVAKLSDGTPAKPSPGKANQSKKRLTSKDMEQLLKGR